MSSQQPAAQPKRYYQLLIRTDGQPDQQIALNRQAFTIGRDPSNDITITSNQISRQHGRLEWTNSTWVYTDKNSQNGSFLNGQRIQRVELQDGQSLHLGNADGKAVTVVLQTTQHTPPAAQVATPGTPSIHLRTTMLGGMQRLLIGRDPRCDIPLNAPNVSRRHARLDMNQSGQHVLTDLDSSIGTFVNGKRVTKPRPLHKGDVIQIGAFRLVYDGMQVQQYDQRGAMRIDALGMNIQVKGGRLILNNVSLSVAPREFIALVGGSGAGKSTLMKVMSGYSRPTSGRVHVNGDDYYRNFNAYRALLGYVPQDDILHQSLTVITALRYAARLRLPPDTNATEINQRITQALSDVNMREHVDTAIERLSGGQRKRVSIASELLAEPTLFFLDEPTSGLDPGLEKKLMETMRQLADQGRTIVLVTHATDNITQCHHVVFMSEGRMVYFGPPSEAMEFFGVTSGSFADIYTRLDGKVDPNDPVVRTVLSKEYAAWYQKNGQSGRTPVMSELWEIRYHQSKQYRRYVYERIKQAPQQPMGMSTRDPRPKQPRVSLLQQFGVLTHRYFDLTRLDQWNLAILLLQAPIIAILLMLLAYPNALTGIKVDDMIPRIEARNLLFVFAAVGVWFGIINAAREIVKENPIYQRERLSNLRIVPYLFSKVSVLTLLICVQNLLLLGVVALAVTFPSTGLLLPACLEMFVTMMLTALAGTTLGLLISSFSKSTDQAISLVPLVLIPQILFAGLIFQIEKGGIIEFISWFMISRWALDALGATVNLNAMCDLPNGGMISCADDGYTLKAANDFPNAFIHTSEHLLSVWGVLLLFIVISLMITAFILKKRDRQV